MGFKFQSTMCNDCNNLLMMSLNINHIIIFNIIGIGYRCIIVGTSKSEDINLLRNTYVSENSHYIYVYLSIYIYVYIYIYIYIYVCIS